MMTPRHGRVVLNLTVAACVVAGSRLPAQQVEGEPPSIPWSAERALAWSNYLGRPDVTSNAAAVTAYKFSYREECVGDAFTFRVVSQFDQALSWVKPNALVTVAGRSRLLVHEQAHFDLSEVQSRKLRRALHQLRTPCSMSSDERKALVMQHIRDDAGNQRSYDADTGFGANDVNQRRWVLDIARELAALSDYAPTDFGPRRDVPIATTAQPPRAGRH